MPTCCQEWSSSDNEAHAGDSEPAHELPESSYMPSWATNLPGTRPKGSCVCLSTTLDFDESHTESGQTESGLSAGDSRWVVKHAKSSNISCISLRGD